MLSPGISTCSKDSTRNSRRNHGFALERLPSGGFKQVRSFWYDVGCGYLFSVHFIMVKSGRLPSCFIRLDKCPVLGTCFTLENVFLGDYIPQYIPNISPNISPIVGWCSDIDQLDQPPSLRSTGTPLGAMAPSPGIRRWAKQDPTHGGTTGGRLPIWGGSPLTWPGKSSIHRES